MTFLTPELLDTKTYGFERLRYILQSLNLQEGVIDPTDLKVVQRAAGANMSVDIGAGRGFVQGDTGTRNGLYHIVNDATVNLAVGASHATLPRVDQIVVEVRDTSDLGSAADDALPRVIAGTATAGTTLDNAYDGSHGAAALPNNCIRIADVLVPAASTSVVTANIRDRRRWARGFNKRIVRAQAADATGYGVGVTQIDSGTFISRLECSGAPVIAALNCTAQNSSVTTFMYAVLNIDGSVTVADSGITNYRFPMVTQPTANVDTNLSGSLEIVPTAGSHVFGLSISFDKASGMVRGQFAVPLVLSLKELPGQFADNT